MRKNLRAVAVLLAAGMAAALPVSLVSAEEPRSTLYAEVERIVLDASGGDLSLEGGLIVWNPDGTTTTQVIDGNEFLAHVRDVTSLVDLGTDAASPGTTGGVGLGFSDARTNGVYARLLGETPQQTLGWPFCDYASVFVFHTGTPGQGVVRREASPVQIPVSRDNLCGGFFQTPTSSWKDVTIDSAGLPGVVRQCGAAMVMLPLTDPNEVQSVTGGYICNKPVGSGHGNGVIASIIWPFPPRIGLTMDSFRGAGNLIAVGDSQM